MDKAIPEFMNPCNKVRESCKAVMDSSGQSGHVIINQLEIDKFVKDVE